VLSGNLPATPIERELLDDDELAAGWRLACRHSASADLTLAIEQWETVILADESSFEFTPREGLGVAVDLGTTTLPFSCWIWPPAVCSACAVNSTRRPATAATSCRASNTPFSPRAGATSQRASARPSAR